MVGLCASCTRVIAWTDLVSQHTWDWVTSLLCCSMLFCGRSCLPRTIVL